MATHVTRKQNVPSIVEEGLKASRGGHGGASDAAGSSEFQKHSKGHVHLTKGGDRGKFYEDFYNEKGIPCEKLDVVPPPSMKFERDPDDSAPGRVRARRSIPPNRIFRHPHGEICQKCKELLKADYEGEMQCECRREVHRNCR